MKTILTTAIGTLLGILIIWYVSAVCIFGNPRGGAKIETGVEKRSCIRNEFWIEVKVKHYDWTRIGYTLEFYEYDTTVGMENAQHVLDSLWNAAQPYYEAAKSCE